MTPDTPNFAAWHHDTLARFAMESYLKMQEQQAQIEQLSLDKKTAIEQYRRLIAWRLAQNDDWK